MASAPLRDVKIALDDLVVNDVLEVRPREFAPAHDESHTEEVPIHDKLSSVEHFYQQVHDISERRERACHEREEQKKQQQRRNEGGVSGGDALPPAVAELRAALRTKLEMARKMVTRLLLCGITLSIFYGLLRY